MLEVINPSILTTVQDAGRPGWQAFGVPLSGPMDAYAHRAANLLVANPPDSPAAEVGLSVAEFRARADCLVAVTGAGFALTINGRSMPLWTSLYVRKNGRILLEKVDGGNWAYLAAHGLTQSHRLLGSCSTYLPARLGALLAPGDLLTIAPAPGAPLMDLAARKWHLPAGLYDLSMPLRVIPGPQADRFSAETLDVFYHAAYRVSIRSDRTGYRLEGPPLPMEHPGELLSEGMARGCIQVPPDGMPIVMQADCPTTGGYPKIASVIRADQPRLAQALPGSRIRFEKTTIEQAQAEYRNIMKMNFIADEEFFLYAY